MGRKLMSFVEFRGEEPELVRQQREHFRDDSAVDAVLQPGALSLDRWPIWAQDSTKVPA